MILSIPWLWAVCAGCSEPNPSTPPPEPLGWLDSSGLTRAVAADQACARGDSAACWWLGVERRWQGADPDGAWAAWSRGCDLGDGPSCEAAALAHRRGEGTRMDLTRAVGRYHDGCTVGHASSCAGESSTIALIRDRDRCWGGLADPEADSCGRACLGSGDAPVCERARVLLDAACEGGDPVSCTRHGLIAADPETASRLLWRACDLDDPWACLILADRVARDEGPNPSPKSLTWLYTQVCDIQLDYGCAVHAVPWDTP